MHIRKRPEPEDGVYHQENKWEPRIKKNNDSENGENWIFLGNERMYLNLPRSNIESVLVK